MKNLLIILTGIAITLIQASAEQKQKTQSKGFTVHEWGTFTSVQGADGRLITWNPFETDKLPSFVYDRSRPLTNGKLHPVSARPVGRLFAKARTSWLQRMETPVIYIYSDQPIQMDIRVDFPKGEITEWYPQVSALGPSSGQVKGIPATNKSFVEWRNVRVEKPSKKKGMELIQEEEANHYYEARDVDSNLLTLHDGLGKLKSPQTEQFLFYRGVGNFESPLNVRFKGKNELVLHHRGGDTIPFMLMLEVIEGKSSFQVLKPIQAKQNQIVHLAHEKTFKASEEVADEVGDVMVQALIESGLFEKEAKSMVATWKPSWFTESGTRVLYILPRTWTDEVLPIRMDPQPDHLERVMVGRAEILTPSMERGLENLYTLLNREQVDIQKAAGQLKDLDLGRFTEPALSRLRELSYRKVSHDINRLGLQYRTVGKDLAQK